MIVTMIIGLLRNILFSIMSERVLTTLIFGLLEKLVASTNNKLDDKILEQVQEEFEQKVK